MHSVPRVALLALLLREAANNHHTAPESLTDDMASYPGFLSLATLAAGHALGETEYALAELLYNAPGWSVVKLAADLHEADEPLHAEALLHAYDTKGKRTRAEWAEPYMNRWWRVRETIANYEAHGITTTLGDVEIDAHCAYKEAMSIDDDELYEQFPPLPDDPLPVG